jgi:integrase
MAGRRQHAEGSLYQRSSDGRWVAVVHEGWKDGRRQRRVFTGLTPKAAVDGRARFLAARRDGFTLPKGRQPYVSEWVLHWLHYTARRRIAATSYGAYRQKVTQLIAPFFEAIPLAGLCEEDLERWHAQLEERVSARTGRPLSAATITTAHRILSSALKEAVVRRRMPRNPCSNVTPPQAAEFAVDPPTAAEVDAILDRCLTWPGGARWVLAICTGLRQGEALALEWRRDVRLAAPAAVSVRWSAAVVEGVRVVKPPKSAASRRSVPLPRVAVAALKLHRHSRIANLANDLVFTDDAGEPVSPKRDWQDWCDLLDDLGLPHYRVHDCRHGYATMLLEEGVDPRVVQELMGWSTASMLKKYQHVRPVMHKLAADAIDRAVGGG